MLKKYSDTYSVKAYCFFENLTIPIKRVEAYIQDKIAEKSARFYPQKPCPVEYKLISENNGQRIRLELGWIPKRTGAITHLHEYWNAALLIELHTEYPGPVNWTTIDCEE